MATWQAIVNGTTYSLSDGNPFKLLGISGIGNAPVRRLEERGPFQDGATDIGYRLDARLINLSIQIVAASLSAADTHRDTLSNIFNPRNGQTIYLRCTRDDSAVRQIDCYSVGMVDTPAELQSRQFGAQRVGVQLKAPNPIWYNPVQTVSTFVPTVSTAFHLIGGLMGSADILTFGTAIGTAAVTWTAGTIAAGEDYSIAFRGPGAARDITGNAFMYNYDGPAPQTSWTQVNAGSVSFWEQGKPTVYLATSAGTVVYVANRDDSGMSFYRDNVLIGVGNTWGAEGINNGRWCSPQSGGSVWGTISHGVVYRKALDANTRSALQDILTGGGTALAGGTITNSGSWDEYPIIIIPGSVASPIVVNTSTGETLDFTGATIPADMSYTIDTRYGYKTVTDSDGVNQIAKLSDDSDLSTFHLAPGVNAITIENASASGTVTIAHYARYLGL